MSTLSLLLQECTQDCNIVTIEATVVTGFEYMAMEECVEKLGKSTKPAVDRGRIYFNIPISNICGVKAGSNEGVVDSNANIGFFNGCDGCILDTSEKLHLFFDKIDDLRSVDNLYVIIKQVTSFGLTKSEGEARESLAQVVVAEEVSKAVSLWCKKNNFKGIAFPSSEQYILAKDVENKLKSLAKTEAETRLTNETSEISETSVQLSDKERRTKLNAYHVAAYHELDSRCPEEKVLKYRVTCYRSGKHNFTSEFAAYRVGGVLQDLFHWIVDLKIFDIEFLLNIKEDSMYYGVALTKESKHNRNITVFGPTTLKATICYNMLRLAKPKHGDIIVDPMCGGGSIPIEGLSAFPHSFYICGDNHEKAISRIAANIENLHPSVRTNHINVFTWDINCLPLRDSSVDIFVTDLPFGKRSGSVFDNRTLYKNVLMELARVVRCKSGQAVLLTCDKKSMAKALLYTAALWSLKSKFKVNIGGLDGSIFLLVRLDKASTMPPPLPKNKQIGHILKKLRNKN